MQRFITTVARKFLVFVAVWATVSVARFTHAQPKPTPAAPVVCAATVYVNDPDPKGANVRSAPDAKSKIASTITDSDSELDITGTLGDWLRVRQVRSVDGTASFKGEGWVFASLVAVRARGAATLRATPGASGVAVVKLRDEEQVSVVSCRGDWLQVKYKTNTGWIAKNSRCGNPVTTCS